METPVFNLKGEEVGKYDLPVRLFGQKPDPHFLHEVITAYTANRRAGTACTKTRSEVSGGGKKPWKQKGTGRARAGSTRSPLWRKGGVVFGPRPRSYYKYISTAKRRQALAQALSAKLAEENFKIIEAADISGFKTKVLNDILRALNAAGGRILFVADKPDKNLSRAGQNIADFSYCVPAEINAYEILRHRKIIFTRPALDMLNTISKEVKADE